MPTARRERIALKHMKLSVLFGASAAGERRPKRATLWSLLGAGLITGASDDDPSGIGTYAQAGAAFGFSLGWTLVLSYPLMVVIQEISARLGRTTGRGIAGNLREHYPNWLLQSIVVMLFVANTLNIGADLGAMAESVRLLLPALPTGLLIFAFGALCTLVQIFVPRQRYVGILKWLTLVLLAYFGVLLIVRVSWTEVLRGLVWPGGLLHRSSWLMVLAIFGTTISPYLFFWQAGQEVEDTQLHPERVPLRRNPAQGPSALARIRLDTFIGMAFSNLVGLAILITAAATIHPANGGDIASAADAAQALRPLAGVFAFSLFALGIIGTGLLAVPVLAASAAYALGEARRWPVGLARNPMHARAFYGTIAAATLGGALANLASVNAMHALVWAAVLNGVVAVPVMTLLMRMAADERILGRFTASRGWLTLGWTATAVMAIVAIGYIVSEI
jgi:NRAMP (natural resistance-associated macrophage protein)-like metal ion transporter